jgi:hypothetical protein
MVTTIGDIKLTSYLDDLFVDRTVGFKVMQWVYVSISCLLLASFPGSIYFLNKDIVIKILDGDNSEKKFLLLLFIVIPLVLSYRYIRLAKIATRSHTITKGQGSIKVDGIVFNLHDFPIEIGANRRVGWQGLGESFDVYILNGSKKTIVLYYITKTQKDKLLAILKGHLVQSPQDQAAISLK